MRSEERGINLPRTFRHRARIRRLFPQASTADVLNIHEPTTTENMADAKAYGQLVVLGFDVTVFTPAPYQRRSLRRPLMEFSSCGWLRT